MIRPISSAFSLFYRHVAKPVMFRISPDKTHEMLINSAKFLQRFALYRLLLNWAWAYKDPDVLGQKIHGVKFINPLGLSAGFDTNFELAPTLKSLGFGLMEGGSLTYGPCVGNPRPWFYRLPNTMSLVVNKGLANQGVKSITSHIQAYPRGTFDNFVLNISVAKTNVQESCTDDGAIADYIGSLKVIKKSDVGDMVTLNISCPNSYGGEPFNTPAKLEKLLQQVDAVKLRPLVFVKMPSDLDWPKFEELLRVVIKHKVAGVTICNLVKNRKNVELADTLTDDMLGNLSGKPVSDISNKLIQKTYENYGQQLTIIGVGGVFSAQDAYTKIKLGASLVEMITGMIFMGPQVVGQINHDLVKLVKKDGYKTITEAIGTDVYS